MAVNFKNKKELGKMVSECLSQDENGITNLSITLISAFVAVKSNLGEKKLQEELVEVLTEVLYAVNHTRIPSPSKEEENNRFELMEFE